MAITNAIMQMRRGYEADFNPSKMRAGEWAVSLDTKYVRMCFAPNVCVRMATYEAFEQDMETVREILSTCETIQSAVEAIQSNIEGIEVVVEDYRNESSASATLSQSYAVGGTNSRAGENTDNAKYYRDKAQSASVLAVSAKDTAVSKATEATNASTEAVSAKDIIISRVDEATTASQEAVSAKNTATTKASEASASALTASTKATEATNSATNAKASENKAREYMENAQRTDVGILSSEVETLKSKVEVTKVSNANPILDCADGNIASIKLYGESHKSKNLLKFDYPTLVSNGVTYKSNGDGTYTVNGTATAHSYFGLSSASIKDIFDVNKNYYLLGNPTNNVNEWGICVFLQFLMTDSSGTERNDYIFNYNPTPTRFRVSDIVRDGETLTKVTLLFRVGKGHPSVNNVILKPMIVDADLYPDVTYADYETYGIIKPSGDIKTNSINSPYEESSTHTDRPLLSIGDIKNELIVNADGTGRFVERVGSITFDGSSDETWSINDINISGKKRINDLGVHSSLWKKTKYNSEKANIISSRFNAIAYDELLNGIEGIAIHSGGSLQIYVENIQNVVDWKAYLASNPLEVIYELENPVITELSASEVSELLSLKTFKTGTSIDTGNAEFEVTYYKDTNAGQAVADVDMKIDKYIVGLQNEIDSMSDNILGTKEEVSANTQAGKVADALVTKDIITDVAQLNQSMSAINIKNISLLTVNATTASSQSDTIGGNYKMVTINQSLIPDGAVAIIPIGCSLVGSDGYGGIVFPYKSTAGLLNRYWCIDTKVQGEFTVIFAVFH